MITLHNGCWCSDISVSPKNWKDAKASVKNPWQIQYVFHDPAFEGYPRLKYGKLVVVKRMNRFKTAAERAYVTKQLIAQEKKILIEEGYNPITGIYMVEQLSDADVNKNTPFIEALEKTLQTITVGKDTKRDIKSALVSIKKSAIDKKFHQVPIHEIRRRHLRLILDNCAKVKEYWSAHLYNHYRAYLMILFKELLELEVVDTNPVNDLSKKEVELNLRELLTLEERIKIDTHFSETDPYYRRFIHIFFHSGARPVELLRLKFSDIDVKRELYKVKVRKGRRVTEQERPIKRIALQYWIDIINESMPGQYIFGKGLRPGDKPATRDYVTKKWQREIKSEETGLGINKDLYSLKHLNLDETAAALDIKAAAKQAGHTTPTITKKHYATGETGRENELLRNMNNEFASAERLN